MSIDKFILIFFRVIAWKLIIYRMNRNKDRLQIDRWRINSMNNNNMDIINNEIFRLGMEIGRKQLADHIVHQFERGKPVEINGELYWLKDAKQNLQDIMDDIEFTWNDEHGVKKFIVPISITYNTSRRCREVIVEAEEAKTAMLIAIGDFYRAGWIDVKDKLANVY